MRRLAGDLQLQNQACEIRIRAERRAGQLLLDMEKNPGTRGTGIPWKDGTKVERSSMPTVHPPKLEDFGISKDQSSPSGNGWLCWLANPHLSVRSFKRVRRMANSPTRLYFARSGRSRRRQRC